MQSHKQQIEASRQRLQQQLRALCSVPLMRGTVSEVRRSCGRKSCACARDPAARHPRKFLTVYLEGRTQGVHLRAEDLERVERAVAAYNELWDIVNELTACEVADLRREARERRRGRTRRDR
jgi:hypothetical protein